VTRQSLSNWENDKNTPSVDVIIKMTELYPADYMSLIDNIRETKKPSVITASRSTYIWCMVLGVILALLIYMRWNNLIFAVIAGVGLPLLLFAPKIFANEFQAVSEHVFYVLFKDTDKAISYHLLKQIGEVETVTNRSIKNNTDLKESELIRVIEDKLHLQEDQFSIIDPAKLYSIRL